MNAQVIRYINTFGVWNVQHFAGCEDGTSC